MLVLIKTCHSNISQLRYSKFPCEPLSYFTVVAINCCNNYIIIPRDIIHFYNKEMLQNRILSLVFKNQSSILYLDYADVALVTWIIWLHFITILQVHKILRLHLKQRNYT